MDEHTKNSIVENAVLKMLSTEKLKIFFHIQLTVKRRMEDSGFRSIKIFDKKSNLAGLQNDNTIYFKKITKK